PILHRSRSTASSNSSYIEFPSAFRTHWNKIEPVWNTAQGGYTEVTTGSSHIQAVGWDAGRCPVARTLLTYAQSSSPNSAHFRDQTRLFSGERWVTARFCEKDILSSPVLKVVRVRER
ncbi:penicillin acylase family protein, partial [Streptomyces sp. NPDC002285]